MCELGPQAALLQFEQKETEAKEVAAPTFGSTCIVRQERSLTASVSGAHMGAKTSFSPWRVESHWVASLSLPFMRAPWAETRGDRQHQRDLLLLGCF